MSNRVSAKRHLAKTLTWRVIATTDTFILAWLVTGAIDWAGMIAGFEVVTKMILYYGHERAWYKYVMYGVEKQEPIGDSKCQD